MSGHAWTEINKCKPRSACLTSWKRNLRKACTSIFFWFLLTTLQNGFDILSPEDLSKAVWQTKPHTERSSLSIPNGDLHSEKKLPPVVNTAKCKRFWFNCLYRIIWQHSWKKKRKEKILYTTCNTLATLGK